MNPVSISRRLVSLIAAAEAMRRILVEQARRKQAHKRGGQQERVELVDVPERDHGKRVDLLARDEALSAFSEVLRLRLIETEAVGLSRIE